MSENIVINYKKYSNLFWKNGFYIPMVSVLLYQATGNLFLSIIVGLKLFPTNFFYWYSVIVLKMSDTTEVIDDEYIVWFNNLWAYAVHAVPIVLLIRELILQDVCVVYFTTNDLYYSYVWVYSWLFLVYAPWRYYTKDPVYSILDANGPFSIKIKIFTIMNVAVFVSNIIGYFISHTICKYQ